MNLGTDKLTFFPGDFASSSTVGSALFDSAGNGITSTLLSGKQCLDVNIASPISVAVDLDGFYVLATNPTPDNIGIIGYQRNAAPGLAQQTMRLTAASPSSNAVVSANSQGLDVNSFLMGYNGATWDRLLSTSGALNVAVTSFSAIVTVDGSVADDAVDSGNPIKVGTRAVSTLSAISAAGDRADMVSDLYRRLYVNNSSNRAGAVKGSTVGVTAVQLDGTPLAGRTRVLIQNAGTKAIYVGFSNAVTTIGTVATMGAVINAGGSLGIEAGSNLQLWAISATAGQTVVLMEMA